MKFQFSICWFVICNRWHFLLHVYVGVWKFYLQQELVQELIQQEYVLLIWKSQQMTRYLVR